MGNILDAPSFPVEETTEEKMTNCSRWGSFWDTLSRLSAPYALGMMGAFQLSPVCAHSARHQHAATHRVQMRAPCSWLVSYAQEASEGEIHSNGCVHRECVPMNR